MRCTSLASRREAGAAAFAQQALPALPQLCRSSPIPSRSRGPARASGPLYQPLLVPGGGNPRVKGPAGAVGIWNLSALHPLAPLGRGESKDQPEPCPLVLAPGSHPGGLWRWGPLHNRRSAPSHLARHRRAPSRPAWLSALAGSSRVLAQVAAVSKSLYHAGYCGLR